MSKDKISSQEMVDQIAAKLSVSKRVAEEFLKSLFAEIEESLLKGESVKIKNLGTFKMQWNEPRKSVNVQTGEVFTIDGYNKVTFTPDADLKEAVNEPYSHLEPVELDGQVIPSFEVEKPIITTPDTLRNLTEQASEIKDILSEINALSAPKEAVNDYFEATQNSKLDIPDYEIILIDEEEEGNVSSTEPDEFTEQEIDVKEQTENVETEVIIVADEPAVESVTEPEIVTVIEPVKEPEIVPTIEPEAIREPEIVQPISEVKQSYEESSRNFETETETETADPFILGPKKKRKGLRFLITFTIILLVIAGGIYATYFSSSCVRCWVQYDLLSETNRQQMNEYLNTFKGWFSFGKSKPTTETPTAENTEKISLPDSAIESDTVTEPVQTIDGQQETPADSLQQLFDKRREYNEFLGEEEITEGTRLTNIAQHYYGKKEFWVYIYEANRDNIVHPDRITPGTVVKIPKVDPRLIDKKNPRCLQKAKELHDLYVGKK